MKISHASDWHLGQNFMGKTREEEYIAFLPWFIQILNILNIKKYEDKIKELEKKKRIFKMWVKQNDIIGLTTSYKLTKLVKNIKINQLIYFVNEHLEILIPRYEIERNTESKKLLEIEIIDGFQEDVVSNIFVMIYIGII